MNGETVTIQQAVAMHQAGQWDRAEAAYRRILDTDPANADALHLSGVIALQRGAFADAVTAIEQAVALRPQQSVFHGNLGTALQGLKRYDAAERHFRTALEHDARNVDARFNLGALHQEKGALDAAVADFAAVIRMQPRMAKAYHRLGMIFRQQGHLKEALR